MPAAPASGRLIRSVTLLRNHRWLRPVQTTPAIKAARMMITKTPVISLTCRNLKRSCGSSPRPSWLKSSGGFGTSVFMLPIGQHGYHCRDCEKSRDRSSQCSLGRARNFFNGSADVQSPDAAGSAGKQGGQDGFGEDVDHVFWP